MKDCSAISRMWRCAAVLVVMAMTVSFSTVVLAGYWEDKNYYEDTLKEWEALAKQGDAEAQFQLGRMYYKVKYPIIRDTEKAVMWVWRAVNQGHAGAERLFQQMEVDSDRDATLRIAIWLEAGREERKANLEELRSGLDSIREIGSVPTKGVKVESVLPGSLAFEKGIVPGDLIVEVSQSEVATPKDIERKFAEARRAGRKSVLVRVEGQSGQRYVAFRLGKNTSGLQFEKKVAKKPSAAVKPSLPTARARDTTPPTIEIASTITVKSDSPSIRGHVSDGDKVVRVTVEGRAADLQSNGTFTFSRYVPTGSEETVRVEAIDEWGNKSTKNVKIVRAVAKTINKLTLAKLNPTTIKGRSNKDAIALVIGVANYSRAPAATFADNDANVFSDYAHRALGIPRSNIKVMVNNKASLADTKVAVKRWLRGRIEEGKTDVNVFFAGHGLASPDGKDLYLLPYDGEPSLLEETALLRRELFEVIGKAKPKSATIFLDTCYSGLSRGKETLLASARGIVVTPKPQSIPKGFTVLSAASGQQISSGLKEAKHGLFSYYLMKGMEGGADANKDRKITASELHAYLGKNVQKQAIRLGREQTPELSGDGERVLVRW